jgi:hypothetical protein
MPRVRPTLRCLREDLKVPISSHLTPLDELDHPLVTKANEQFADPNTPPERIVAIDDEVLFKVKIGRWRGAVWDEHDLGWLVGAGRRETGSPDDFYADLEASCEAARKRYNATHPGRLRTRTHTVDLLPADEDRERYQAEAVVRLVRGLVGILHNLLRASLRDGREHTHQFETFRLGVIVRADQGHETYVILRVAGSVPDDLVAVILSNVPGCEEELWDYRSELPTRPRRPQEDVWLNLMDPAAAAKLLDTG